MLEVGKYAFDMANSANIQILRIETWGYISYRFYNLVSSQVYKLSEEQLKVSNVKDYLSHLLFVQQGRKYMKETRMLQGY